MTAKTGNLYRTSPYDNYPMVNTFGILTAIILAFSAFVAYSNKGQFNTKVELTSAQQKDYDRNVETYNALLEDITSLEDVTKETEVTRDVNLGKLKEQTASNDALKADIASKESELTSTKNKVADAQEKLKELGDLEELAPKIERLQASIDELKKQVTTLNSQVERLQGEKSRTGEVLVAAKAKQSQITSGQSFPTMKTTIRSIDRRLGIVTLAAGIRSGVIGGSKVAVMRGGEKIAELNVKAVSANLATADVIQSTLQEGVNVGPGDIVIPVESASSAN